jgi:hypothetical protein
MSHRMSLRPWAGVFWIWSAVTTLMLAGTWSKGMADRVAVTTTVSSASDACAKAGAAAPARSDASDAPMQNRNERVIKFLLKKLSDRSG